MMKLHSVAVAALLVVTSAAAAQQQPDESSRVHEVRTGDTLWDLAARYLGNPFRWPEIYSINRPSVLDPDLIFPRETILIPGNGSAPGRETTVFAPDAAASRTVFFSTETARAEAAMTIRRSQTTEGASIPAGTFNAAGVLAPDSLFESLGELVSVVSPTVVQRNTEPQIQPYDRVNVALSDSVRAGDRVQFVRGGQLIEPYGRVFLPTGSGVVQSLEGRVATVEVDQFYDRVEVGDLVVRMPAPPAPAAFRRGSVSAPGGVLIGFTDDQPVVSTDDMGFVNLGSSSGVSQGDELVAYLPATERTWGREPEVLVARLQVIRVAPEVSTVRVISLEQPALEPGMPVRLLAGGQ